MSTITNNNKDDNEKDSCENPPSPYDLSFSERWMTWLKGAPLKAFIATLIYSFLGANFVILTSSYPRENNTKIGNKDYQKGEIFPGLDDDKKPISIIQKLNDLMPSDIEDAPYCVKDDFPVDFEEFCTVDSTKKESDKDDGNADTEQTGGSGKTQPKVSDEFLKKQYCNKNVKPKCKTDQDCEDFLSSNECKKLASDGCNKDKNKGDVDYCILKEDKLGLNRRKGCKRGSRKKPCARGSRQKPNCNGERKILTQSGGSKKNISSKSCHSGGRKKIQIGGAMKEILGPDPKDWGACPKEYDSNQCPDFNSYRCLHKPYSWLKFWNSEDTKDGSKKFISKFLYEIDDWFYQRWWKGLRFWGLYLYHYVKRILLMPYVYSLAIGNGLVKGILLKLSGASAEEEEKSTTNDYLNESTKFWTGALILQGLIWGTIPFVGVPIISAITYLTSTWGSFQAGPSRTFTGIILPIIMLATTLSLVSPAVSALLTLYFIIGVVIYPIMATKKSGFFQAQFDIIKERTYGLLFIFLTMTTFYTGTNSCIVLKPDEKNGVYAGLALFFIMNILMKKNDYDQEK